MFGLSEPKRSVNRMTRRLVPTEHNLAALHQQVEKLLTENWELKSKLNAVTAELKAFRGDEPDNLLESIAAALRDSRLAALASPVSQPLDPVTRHQQPHSKAPSRPQGPANAERGLRTALGRAVSTYESRRDREWHSPTRDLEERVRCRTRGCPRLDRRTPKLVQVGGSTISFDYCSACGGKLSAA